MATDITPPESDIIVDLVEAFRRSKTMFVAVSMGVFDALETGPKTLPALAAELKSSADGLERLLDACVCLQLLRHTPAGYENTPAAKAYLCKSSPKRMTGYINYSNEVMWKLWANLEDAIREGSNRWKQTYGWDGPIFSHFFRTDEAMREFLMGMHGFGIISSPYVVGAFDLSRFRKLVDLGGATGHLTIAACQRWLNLRGMVFDLPQAVPLAREIVSATSVANRIEIMAGDFFADQLPEADLYALGRILHDWSDAKIDLLLKKIFARLPAGGALLIAEKLLEEDKSGPRWGHMQNLNMLTCTEGKERTLAQYEAILKRIGFGEVTGCRTPGQVDATLAVK